MEKVYLTPQTIKLSILPPELFKTVYFTPGRFSMVVLLQFGGFAIVMVVLSFSFLFISGESLKNHSKSQKNYKMENLILLDST